MTRKDRIRIQRDEDFSAMDADLDAAMNLLNSTNERVAELLDELAPPPEESENTSVAEVQDKATANEMDAGEQVDAVGETPGDN